MPIHAIMITLMVMTIMVVIVTISTALTLAAIDLGVSENGGP